MKDDQFSTENLIMDIYYPARFVPEANIQWTSEAQFFSHTKVFLRNLLKVSARRLSRWSYLKRAKLWAGRRRYQTCKKTMFNCLTFVALLAIYKAWDRRYTKRSVSSPPDLISQSAFAGMYENQRGQLQHWSMRCIWSFIRALLASPSQTGTSPIWTLSTLQSRTKTRFVIVRWHRTEAATTVGGKDATFCPSSIKQTRIGSRERHMCEMHRRRHPLVRPPQIFLKEGSNRKKRRRRLNHELRAESSGTETQTAAGTIYYDCYLPVILHHSAPWRLDACTRLSTTMKPSLINRTVWSWAHLMVRKEIWPGSGVKSTSDYHHSGTERSPLNFSCSKQETRDSSVGYKNYKQALQQYKDKNETRNVILKRNNAMNTDLEAKVLKRLWKWALSHRLPNSCLLNTRRNYKINANGGSTELTLRHHLKVPNSRAVPNFI